MIKKLGYILFEVVNWVVAHLPLVISYMLSKIIYISLYYFTKYRRSVTHQNLRNAFPEKSEKEIHEIEKAYYKRLSYIIPEVLQTKYASKEYIQKKIHLTGYETIDQHLEKGRKVIILSAHFGNWEWGSLILGFSTDFTLYSTYKPISNHYFDQYYQSIRSKFGNITLPMQMMPRTLLAEKNPCVTGILADQTPINKQDVWVKFLHQDTLFYGGVEKLARKIEAAVVYADMWPTTDGNYELAVSPICDNAAKIPEMDLTNTYVSLLEKSIIARPSNWLWSHKRWKHKRPTS